MKHSMTIQTVSDSHEWERLLKPWHNETTFLQAWAWGELHERLGFQVMRFSYQAKGATSIGLCQAILFSAKRGRFLLVPHGPLIDWHSNSIVAKVCSHLRVVARQHNAAFLRVSPYLADSDVNRAMFRKQGFRPAPIHAHPELMWTLDVAPTSDVLLKAMRKGTRYAILKAMREGVTVSQYTDSTAIADFYPLFKETVVRHPTFVPFTQGYIEQELAAFAKSNEAVLFLGRYKTEVLAGALVIYHGASAYYHQGASSQRFSNIPAAYAVQWAAIQEAKKRGCRFYNFWGIVDDGANHPWSGITFFKKGFGGFETRLLHAQDAILSPRYWLTYAIERVRRFRRYEAHH